MLGAVLDDDNDSDDVWADSAYRSQLIESVLALLGFVSRIHERAYRNRPLTEEQKESNRERSKVRAKVEHVFGTWVNSMGGKLMRSIGKQSVNLDTLNPWVNFFSPRRHNVSSYRLSFSVLYWL